MKEWLVFLTEQAIVLIDFIALLLVVYASLEAFVRSLPLFVKEGRGMASREIWLRYARWLVAALTFQLAADIIESSITVSWEAVARLGAIALIRTFLNYYLEKDLAEVRELQHDGGGEGAAARPR